VQAIVIYGTVRNDHIANTGSFEHLVVLGSVDQCFLVFDPRGLLERLAEKNPQSLM
jgi:hypothetical protein